MAELHHFAYGWFTPVVSYLMAFLGALLGLLCLARARRLPARRRRVRWLVLAAFGIGGAGIWLMHFMAMLGFDLPASPVRYDARLTAVSLGVAVLTVGIGLFTMGTDRGRWHRTLLGGAIVGAGAVAMHYTGMAAVRVAGDISFDRPLVGASAGIAVAAATGGLYLTTALNGWAARLAGATILGGGFVGMHYTAMMALRVQLYTVEGPVSGLSPLLMIVPITLLAAAALIAMAFSALQAMTEEEFAGDGVPRDTRPVSVQGEIVWPLRQIEAPTP